MYNGEAMNHHPKPLVFMGDSVSALREFSPVARRRAGQQLYRVQCGGDADDWKPIPGVGPGVREIRVKDEAGIYRVFYVAKFLEAVYLLHCFQKKSQKTSQSDMETGIRRFKELLEERKS